jgi:hypothetical protein
MPRIALALLAMVPVSLTGCTIAWQGNFSYTYGAGNPCAITMDWCIFELPGLGYLGVKADSGVGLEYTGLAVRLAPRAGVSAAWSAREVRIIDLDSKAVQEKAVLETRIVSTLAPPAPAPELVFHGAHSDADFSLRPRIKRFELRFPEVRSGDARLQVPAVQIVDGARFPMPVPWFMAGH